MTTEIFKDEIDLQDNDKYFKIQVCAFNDGLYVLGRKVSDKLDDYHYKDYDTLFTYESGYYPKLPGGGYSNNYHESELKYHNSLSISDVNIIKNRIVEHGLCYCLYISEDYNPDRIIEKISKE